MIDASLQKILDRVNIGLAKQDYKIQTKHFGPGPTFEEYLNDVPPEITPAENIWYYYVPAILRGAAILLRGTVAGNAAVLLSSLKEGKEMNPSQIDITTNIIAILLAILEPVKAYLSSQPFEWGTFTVCILGAVVAYFTGKSGVRLQQSNDLK